MTRTPRVKICGLTRAEDVRACLAAGVDLIGLNLARGPRRIAVEQAAVLAAMVPPGVGVVALFVDAAEEAVLAAAAALRASAIQLHGDEPPELADRLRRRFPVIKAFRIAGRDDLIASDGYPADAYLLDAAVAGAHGGTGVSWEHGWLQDARPSAPVILAGGLRPGNVADAVRAVRPWAVDTASGVESSPGVKDAALVAAFAANARTA